MINFGFFLQTFFTRFVFVKIRKFLFIHTHTKSLLIWLDLFFRPGTSYLCQVSQKYLGKLFAMTILTVLQRRLNALLNFPANSLDFQAFLYCKAQLKLLLNYQWRFFLRFDLNFSILNTLTESRLG